MKISTVPALRNATSALRRLLDEDPQRAVDEARALIGRGQVRIQVRFLRATLLVDGGALIRDEQALREGVRIFRDVLKVADDKAGVGYNVANGLDSLTKLADWSSPDAYVTTHAERREMRRLLHDAAKAGEDFRINARAWTNLGNCLDHAFRWAEAYDCWTSALAHDPSNAVPALCIAQMLAWRCRRFSKHPPGQHRVSAYYERYARRHAREIAYHAGAEAARSALSTRPGKSHWKPRKISRLKGEYSRFVAEHRLALVAMVEGVDFRKKRWDDVNIRGVSESLDKEGVPPVFAMINQLKADFCTARWLAYAADVGSPAAESRHPIPDTSSYSDTLDYALYGTSTSMLLLAQRSALDLLDRVAACANDFFSVQDQPTRVHFREFWREQKGTGNWRPELSGELASWNPGVIALGDLASDLTEGSWLASKAQLRNLGTHRFCVLHDLGKTPSRPSPVVAHQGVAEFFEETIASLRIARSAILYLIDAINWHEMLLPKKGPRLEIPVVSHHYIRGED